MKWLIVTAAALALVAGAGTASAQTSHKNGFYNSQGQFTQRNVRLRSQPAAPLPNADLKYGPYPEYPQSPPQGGGN